MNFLRYLLLPFSFGYGAIIFLRNLAYDKGWKKSHSVPVPTISVGNITVGGTGKTPMAEFLLGELESMGKKPAYLSRGYGRSSRGYLRVDPTDNSGLRYGDEAFQVASKYAHLPVAVCEDRVGGVKRLLSETDADVVVLDDAFQHRRIQRDLDIVMVDGNRLPATDFLLPAGNLRESRRGLHRADAVVVAKRAHGQAVTDIPHLLEAGQYRFETLVFELEAVSVQHFFSEHSISLAELKQKSAHLFAGLGNNSYFFAQASNLLGVALSTAAFADHHAYTEGDVRKILANVETTNENKPKFDRALLLTTEKDYFRLKSTSWIKNYSDFPLYYLQVKMRPIVGWEQLQTRITQILNTYGKYK